MSSADHIRDRIDALRQGTVAVLDDLTATARAFEPPEPLPAVADLRRKLVDNTYQVLD